MSFVSFLFTGLSSSSTMATKTLTKSVRNTAATRHIVKSLSSSSSFPSSKTSYCCSQKQLQLQSPSPSLSPTPSQLRFFSTTSSITDDEENKHKPIHYVVRSKRMTPTNGIETDLYDRAKRKNRSAPTRDLNYTADMWTKHKSPWYVNVHVYLIFSFESCLVIYKLCFYSCLSRLLRSLSSSSLSSLPHANYILSILIYSSKSY